MSLFFLIFQSEGPRSNGMNRLLLRYRYWNFTKIN